MRIEGISLAVACALAIGAPVASADRGEKAGEKATPWSAGVSKADQARALELFNKGNAFFEEGKYTEALAQYEKALPIWDHPNIEFNLAVCLFNIRQPLEAWDHLEKALRFGEAPLGKRLFGEAQTYRTLLETSLAQLEVEADQDDVQVMLDGKELDVTPPKGKAAKVLHLLAGTHQLVATRKGFQTESRALDLPAGKVTHEAIELRPEKVKVKVKVETVRENYERRWSWWVPWSAMGTGVALALGGTGVYLAARSDMKSYDSALATQCPQGCRASDIPASLTSQQQHAQRLSSIGIGLWGAGAAVGVAAGVMAIMNRPRQTSEGHPEMALVVTPGYTGASVAFTFR